MDWHGSGMSVMEMSHRGEEFIAIHAQAEADLRALLGVPPNYKVLFPAGRGGCALRDDSDEPPARPPVGRLREHRPMVEKGDQRGEALLQSPRRGELRRRELHLRAEASDVEARPRRGVRAHHVERNDRRRRVPLDARTRAPCRSSTDASSHILSRPMDVSRYGLIYAGAQKNIGPAGLTIVIVRDDLIGQSAAGHAFRLRLQGAGGERFDVQHASDLCDLHRRARLRVAEEASAASTKMEELNIAKANVIYEYLDQTEFYHSPVAKEDRSRMNIPFTLRNDELDDAFLKGAESEGLTQLKGHRSVGGMRASIYNAMPIEGVRALVQYMREFERKHG